LSAELELKTTEVKAEKEQVEELLEDIRQKNDKATVASEGAKQKKL
jgi:hypothetical protein